MGLFISTARHLLRRQVSCRVNRLALAANFKMKLHPFGIAVAHFSNFLAFFHLLVFFDQQRLVVRVGR